MPIIRLDEITHGNSIALCKIHYITIPTCLLVQTFLPIQQVPASDFNGSGWGFRLPIPRLNVLIRNISPFAYEFDTSTGEIGPYLVTTRWTALTELKSSTPTGLMRSTRLD
jgi:hypothetical protein